LIEVVLAVGKITTQQKPHVAKMIFLEKLEIVNNFLDPSVYARSPE